MKNCWLFLAVLFAVQIASAQIVEKSHEKNVAEKLGYPADSRLLIIHAEDVGMAHSINRATFLALEKGWVTSASVLVPCPWFPEVAAWSKLHPGADLGVRLDYNSDWERFRWGPVSTPAHAGLIDKDGYLPLQQRAIAANANLHDMEVEGVAQVDKALKAGIKVSHLDNHMKILVWSPEMFKIYWTIGKEYKLPLLVPWELALKRGAPLSDGRYQFGPVIVNRREFPVDRVLEMQGGVKPEDWLSAYERTLASLGPGVYVLGVHLGYDDEELRGMTAGHPNWGSAWRQRELDAISSSEFQKFIKEQGFILISWRDLAKLQ